MASSSVSLMSDSLSVVKLPLDELTSPGIGLRGLATSGGHARASAVDAIFMGNDVNAPGRSHLVEFCVVMLVAVIAYLVYLVQFP